MSRTAVRAALAVGALGLLLLGVAWLLVARVDADAYKSWAVEWMQSKHQRRLVIEGPVELTLLPRLALKVSGVTLSEPRQPTQFAAIEEAALSVRLWPLLRGEVRVDGVSARGVRLAYRRDEGGRRNLDDLLQAQTEPADAASASAPTGPPPDLELGSLRLDDVHLLVDDRMAQVAADVTLQRLHAGRIAARVPTPLSLQARVVLHRPQAASLDLDGRLRLTPDLEAGRLALHEVELEVQGEGAGLRGLALSLSGALDWDGSALSAGPLQLALKSATHGAVVMGASTLSVQRALLSPAEQRLELQALKLALAGRHGDQGFSLALDWPTLAVAAEQLSGAPLSGRLSLDGGVQMAGDFRSAAPSGRFDRLRLPGLALVLKGHAGPRRVEARLRGDVLLRLQSGSAALEALDTEIGLSDPGLPPLRLLARGRAGVDAQGAGWALAGSLNGNAFRSDGRAALGGAVPKLAASAHFDALDLNRVLPAPGPAASAARPAPTDADTPVPLQALKALDGRFTLSAGSLALRQYRVADLALAATLDAGVLRVSQLRGAAWGGRFSGSAGADAQRQQLSLTLDATGVDVDALLRDVAGRDVLEGRGRVSAALVATGASVGAMRRHLDGSAALDLRDGAVKGFNLARALRQARAALTRREDAQVQARRDEKTDFSELSISARIQDGVARSDDLALKSPFLRLGGAGQVDIGRQRVDYAARATVVASAVGQGGAGFDALRGVTVPVRLSGPFDDIGWKVQWSGAAAAALGHRLQDKLGEELGERLGGKPGLPAPGGAASAPSRPQDRLKDALREWLK